mmetsp:Transcript_17949/g.28657  ORF Transcript_17949/g.28657 Transcript_17949/m.28657 type:complete len:101 (+) Transcript_17949:278-580(+)
MISGQLRAHAWRLISTRGADKTPTSGFIGVLVALYSCESVTLYGFGAYAGARRNASEVFAFRYYSSSDERPFAYGHKWNVEEALLAHWATQDLLSRVYDS